MDSWNLFESGALVWIQHHLRIEVLDAVMPWISKLNNAGMIAILTVVVLLLWKRYRNVGVTAFCSLLVEFIVLNLVFKPIVHRTRPYIVNEAIDVLCEIPTDYSFPSGHTGAAFAVALVLLFTMPKKYGVTATVFATVIAFSRLYNGVHYPTDILGGLIIALITSLLATKIVYPRITELLLRKENRNSET